MTQSYREGPETTDESSTETVDVKARKQRITAEMTNSYREEPETTDNSSTETVDVKVRNIG